MSADVTDPVRAVNANDPTFRFRWERAIRGDRQLKSMTRLVLLVLGTRMNNNGTNAFPTIERLAAECGMTQRSASTHVRLAIKAGWLERTRTGRNVGSGTEHHGIPSVYAAVIPPLAAGTKQHPATEDDEWQPESDARQPESDDMAAGRKPRPTSASTASTASNDRQSDVVEGLTEQELWALKLEWRERIREYEEESGRRAGGPLRDRIWDQVLVDAELDASPNTTTTDTSQAAKTIEAARTYGRRWAASGFSEAEGSALSPVDGGCD